MDAFGQAITYIQKGARFKLENDCLVFQTLDAQKIYKISFLNKEFSEKSRIFIPVKGLERIETYFWSSKEKEWRLLTQTFVATPALKLKLINKDNVCFESFIFNTVLPYF